MPTGIFAFNSDNNFMRYALLSSFLCYRYENWGIAQFLNLPATTHYRVVALGFELGQSYSNLKNTSRCNTWAHSVWDRERGFVLTCTINVNDICKVCCVPIYFYFRTMLEIMVKQNICIKRTQIQLYNTLSVKMHSQLYCFTRSDA